MVNGRTPSGMQIRH